MLQYWQAVKKDLHDYNQQGTYNRLSHSTPASSLPFPDTLGAAFHKPHPSPLKDAVKSVLTPADAPPAPTDQIAARSSHTGMLLTSIICSATAELDPAASHHAGRVAGADRSIQLTSAIPGSAAADEDLSHPLQPPSETEAGTHSLQVHDPASQAGHHTHQQPRRPRSSVGGISAMDT